MALAGGTMIDLREACLWLFITVMSFEKIRSPVHPSLSYWCIVAVILSLSCRCLLGFTVTCLRFYPFKATCLDLILDLVINNSDPECLQQNRRFDDD
jgi:hypothetical protein